MTNLNHLLESNRRWATATYAADPDFFEKSNLMQTPKYLWIGCSDSRVPATQVTGLKPGEIFEHRNVANLVVHSDLNCLSVIQYAIDVLQVEHILVVGHYGCRGVCAALEGSAHGLVDNWLRHIQDVIGHHEAWMSNQLDFNTRWKALCEFNVIEQVRNIARTTVVGHAWRRGQNLKVHGWIYGINDGIIKDLSVTLDQRANIESVIRSSIEKSYTRHTCNQPCARYDDKSNYYISRQNLSQNRHIACEIGARQKPLIQQNRSQSFYAHNGNLLELSR
ncbi:carbonate dehydratase [Candidatus Methylospira mobilis]|uniref:carbonate dehydratase n=1 Tax=Candidatus Methylospira mobilis TaxID=1808979 RepID=UPI0028E54578|nr:carbonate dehydratase [Candidatus Methylospira mobilis]WNV04233.1 carbonate dehydratase [Candidatus Methylospira mobilis]